MFSKLYYSSSTRSQMTALFFKIPMGVFIFLGATCILKINCDDITDMRHERALLQKERQDNQIDPSRLVAVLSEYILDYAKRHESAWEAADFAFAHHLTWEPFLKKIGAFPSRGTLNANAKPLIIMTEEIQKRGIINSPLLAKIYHLPTGSPMLIVENVLKRFYEAYRDQVVKTGTVSQLDKQFKIERMAEFISLARWIIKRYLETERPVPSKNEVSKADLDKLASNCFLKKWCTLKNLGIAGGVVALGVAGKYGIPWLLDAFRNSANSTEPIVNGTNMPNMPKETKEPDYTEMDDNDSSSFSWYYWIFLGLFLSLLVLPIIVVLLLALWYRHIRPREQVSLSDPVEDDSDSSIASSTNSIYGPPPREPFPPRLQNPDIPSPLNPNASCSNLSSLGTQRRAEELGLKKSKTHKFLNRRYSA